MLHGRFGSRADVVVRSAPKAIGRGMSGLGVRRAKAALSSGCKSHPATAPAGSNRSSHGGNEVAEAFGWRVTIYGDSASVQAVTRVNAEQASKRNAQADPTTLSGKADTAGRTSESRHPAAAPAGSPRGTGRALWGGGGVHSTA